MAEARKKTKGKWRTLRGGGVATSWSAQVGNLKKPTGLPVVMRSGQRFLGYR